MAILTLSFYFVRVSTPHYLPHVLLYQEGSPLRPLGFLLVKNSHHRPHLQAVEDAGTGLCPVQHPGGCDRTSSPRSTAGSFLCTAIEAATEPGCTHPHCIAMRKACRNLDSGWGCLSVNHSLNAPVIQQTTGAKRKSWTQIVPGRGFKCYCV